MKNKILIGSILAVVIIVLSSFSSVVGKLASDNELVEFDVEFCGLGKKHTVQLTQQEADEVDQLFDNIEQRISKVETRAEAEVIFKEAVVDLDNYELLGGLSVRQAQNLVTGKYQKLPIYQEQAYISNENDYYNSNCLMIGDGKSDEMWYSLGMIYSIIASPLLALLDYIFDNMDDIPTPLEFILGSLIEGIYFSIIFISLLKPLHLFCNIGFGKEVRDPFGGSSRYYPAVGKITSIGLKGLKTYEGEFYGNLGGRINFALTNYYIGAKGFTGIKLGDRYFGYAVEVGLDREHPWY